MSATVAPEIPTPPQPQPRRKLDIAVLRVNELLRKHPEYSSTVCHVALAVALHMRRHADGFYRCTLRQGDTGVLVKEVRASRRTIQRALDILCASGGIFKAQPRYGQRGRLANDYILIEAPKAYYAPRADNAGAVAEFTPRRRTPGEKQAADALCAQYAEWYLELRGMSYITSPADRSAALPLLREYGAYPDYLRDLLRGVLARQNEKHFNMPGLHSVRLLCHMRAYVMQLHELWVQNRESWVPEALLTC